MAVAGPGCAVTDSKLTELSGLAVRGGELWGMADGGRRLEVVRLDAATCAVVARRDARIDPYDPEDLAVGPGGTLWVGDIGDNQRRRDTIAVIELPAQGAATLHRLSYPDGAHDAEALLVDGEGRPVVVTKEVGTAGIYRAPALRGAGPLPLERVGTVTLPPSDTAGGPVGSFGSSLVTGAAQTDGVVALRSYTDAWLYPVAGGDVVGALSGTPARVPLPDEPQGEAIAFDADGTLISGSEARGGQPGRLRTVPGAAALVRAPSPTPAPVAPAGRAAGPTPWSAQYSALVGGAATLALLVLAGLAVALRGAGRR